MNSTVMAYSGKFFVNFSIMFAKRTVRIPGSITIFAIPSSQRFFFDTFEQMTVGRKAIELFGVIFDPLVLNTFELISQNFRSLKNYSTISISKNFNNNNKLVLPSI